MALQSRLIIVSIPLRHGRWRFKENYMGDFDGVRGICSGGSNQTRFDRFLIVAAALCSFGSFVGTGHADEPPSAVEMPLRLSKPVKTGIMTSPFGYTLNPVTAVLKLHSGVDWAAPIGTPLYATGRGRIVKASLFKGRGLYIKINHSNGYVTTYSHLSAIRKGIRPGIWVAAGEGIGSVGNTGHSTGPHVHYEVIIGGIPVNPMQIPSP